MMFSGFFQSREPKPKVIIERPSSDLGWLLFSKHLASSGGSRLFEGAILGDTLCLFSVS